MNLTLKLNINGNEIATDVPGYFHKSQKQVLVPLRVVGEELGYTVVFKEVSGEITLIKNERSVVIDSAVNEVVILNNRTLVPLGFVEKTLEQEVMWDEKNKMVFINS